MVNPESYTYVVMAELKPTMFDNCTFCKKEIQTNVMKIRCPICNFWRHMKCTQMINSAIGADDTICPNCISTILPFNGIQDDEEFLYAISGNSSIANVDYDKLSRIKLELHDHCDAKRSVYEENLDADTNYYNTHFSSTASYLGTDK